MMYLELEVLEPISWHG